MPSSDNPVHQSWTGVDWRKLWLLCERHSLLFAADANLIWKLGSNSLVSQFTFILRNNLSLFNICRSYHNLITIMWIKWVLQFNQVPLAPSPIKCLNPVRQSLKYFYHLNPMENPALEINFWDCKHRFFKNNSKKYWFAYLPIIPMLPSTALK